MPIEPLQTTPLRFEVRTPLTEQRALERIRREDRELVREIEEIQALQTEFRSLEEIERERIIEESIQEELRTQARLLEELEPVELEAAPAPQRLYTIVAFGNLEIDVYV